MSAIQGQWRSAHIRAIALAAWSSTSKCEPHRHYSPRLDIGTSEPSLFAMRTRALLRWLPLFLAAFLSTALAADPTQQDALAVLRPFAKPGADLPALSKAFQPTAADYAAVFEPAVAAKVEAAYTPAWTSGQLVIKPNEGQTDVLVDSVRSADVRAWNEAAQKVLPGGWAKMKGQIKDGYTLFRFKFVKPGERSGMVYDGLILVNGHWRIFPKAWRALE